MSERTAEGLMLDLLMTQCEILNQILKQLMAIQEILERPDPDAEPDPFETLNG